MVKKALTNLKNQLSEEEFLLGDAFSDSPAGDWFTEVQTEGNLAVDVYQTANDVVVKAPVAGVNESDIDITVLPDQVSIRGERKEEKEVAEDGYHTRECYWGAFSRTVALPVEGEPDGARATFKSGILTVRIPKSKKGQAVKLKIQN